MFPFRYQTLLLCADDKVKTVKSAYFSILHFSHILCDISVLYLHIYRSGNNIFMFNMGSVHTESVESRFNTLSMLIIQYFGLIMLSVTLRSV